jgi:hypothetical protein
MTVLLRYRGREIREEDVRFVRAMLASHPTLSRRRLSKLVCQAWDWRQANGHLRDMVCRGLLLALERAGLLELPALRWRPPNNVVLPRPRPPVEVDRTPLVAPLGEIRPVEIVEVRRRPEEALFDSLLQDHHYLGYRRPVGEHLKYLAFSRGGRPLACLGFGSAPRHLAPRDRFIGWSPPARAGNLRFLAYNARFLILPWVAVPHLASHLLAALARRISADWERLYGHPVYYLETFIDPGRFRGTCYRAANWQFLGTTTGRGKADQTHRPNRPRKEVLGLPLVGDFRERLSGAR